MLQPLREPNVPLKDVIGELRLKILDKQRYGNEWVFLIGRQDAKPDLPPSDGDCICIYSGVENNPLIYEEEAAAIRRRFKPDKPGKIITLGL